MSDDDRDELRWRLVRWALEAATDNNGTVTMTGWDERGRRIYRVKAKRGQAAHDVMAKATWGDEDR